MKLMQKATVMPPRKVDYHDETETVQMRLYKSLKLWSMYADLEESFGTFKVMEFLLCVCVCACVCVCVRARVRACACVGGCTKIATICLKSMEP